MTKKQIKVGDKIRDNVSLEEFEIIKLFPGNVADLRALKPMDVYHPPYYETFSSIKLVNYTII